MTTTKCPCCGQALDSDLPARALSNAPLRPMQRRIIDVLSKTYPRGLSAVAIASRVYASDPDGGPMSADNAVSVHLHAARRIIRQYGWTVGAGGETGNIRLQRLAQ